MEEDLIKKFEEEMSRISTRREARELFQEGGKILEKLKSKGLVNSELYDEFLKLQNRLSEKNDAMDNAAAELKQN